MFGLFRIHTFAWQSLTGIKCSREGRQIEEVEGTATDEHLRGAECVHRYDRFRVAVSVAQSDQAISPTQSYRQLNKEAEFAGVESIGNHTLRKTFGY